jgi:hypothetical protein
MRSPGNGNDVARADGSPGRLSLEMTFWRVEPLNELVELAHRCAARLEGLVSPPAHCNLKVYAVVAETGRAFEVEVSLVGLATCTDSVCYRGSDLFATVEHAFAALVDHVCQDAERSGVRLRAFASVRPSAVDDDDGAAGEATAVPKGR